MIDTWLDNFHVSDTFPVPQSIREEHFFLLLFPIPMVISQRRYLQLPAVHLVLTISFHVLLLQHEKSAKKYRRARRNWLLEIFIKSLIYEYTWKLILLELSWTDLPVVTEPPTIRAKLFQNYRFDWLRRRKHWWKSKRKKELSTVSFGSVAGTLSWIMAER